MIFAVWKPKGPTSHDIVLKIRKLSGEKTVGHAGTLDPLAEGILVIGVGKEATKKLKSTVGEEKEYIATIKLGEESTTDDAEGIKTTKYEINTKIRKDDIQKVLQKFTGEFLQTPPLYSAVKFKGREAYKYARKGEKVGLKPREVLIKEIEILDYSWPNLKIRVVTGPGVYIRALARDLGRALGVGGYLAELTRTRIGDFTKEKCVNISTLKSSG